MSLIQELKKPYNLISFVLTIFSIALSFYFYFKSEKEKNISYIINEPASLIFDSKNSTPAITIYEKNSIPIKKNIYLLTGTVWNSGDFPIDKIDLRIPLSIKLNNTNRIIDYKITKQKDETVSKFSIKKQGTNCLNLYWNYFDPEFGFKFQIIYVGSSNPGFKLNGKVLGINEFKKVKIEKKIDTNLKFYAMAFFGLIMLISLTAYWREKELNTSKVTIWISLMQLILSAIGLITLLLFYLFKTDLPQI